LQRENAARSPNKSKVQLVEVDGLTGVLKKVVPTDRNRVDGKPSPISKGMSPEV